MPRREVKPLIGRSARTCRWLAVSCYAVAPEAANWCGVEMGQARRSVPVYTASVPPRIASDGLTCGSLCLSFEHAQEGS